MQSCLLIATMGLQCPADEGQNTFLLSSSMRMLSSDLMDRLERIVGIWRGVAIDVYLSQTCRFGSSNKETVAVALRQQLWHLQPIFLAGPLTSLAASIPAKMQTSISLKFQHRAGSSATTTSKAMGRYLIPHQKGFKQLQSIFLTSPDHNLVLL